MSAERTDSRRDGAEAGASMVEYALLIALIALVAIVAVTIAGESVSSTFDDVAQSLGN